MLRGCLLFLSFWLGLSAIYVYTLSHVLEMTPAAITGGVVGFLVLFLFGAWKSAWSTARFRRLIEESQSCLPLEDGREVAVCGTIHPRHEPVRAPFTGEPCILCEYSVRRADDEEEGSRDTSPHTSVDLSGYLMNPCVVRSPFGEVALFGFPQLDGFSDEIATLPGQVRRARTFVESTEFENIGGVRIVGAVSSLNQVFADEDGAVNRHFRIGQNASDLFDSSRGIPQLAETRVPVGAPVCALGVYSEVHRALATANGLRTVLTRLYFGRPDEVGERLLKQSRQQFAVGLLGLLVIHAILAGAIILQGLEA